MLASLFSKPQSSLSVQAKRLVAMRFLIYTGFQTSYFIGVIGTLTYADDASVVATSLAVLFMNVFVILDPLRVALRSTPGVRAAISC